LANQQIILTFVPLIANLCLLMKKQITNTVLMVRPVRFRMNEQTVVNNYFQEEMDLKNDEINRQAQQEFDVLVEKLRTVGVKVIVVDDIYEQNTPDSVFPNNWITFHQNGDVAIYPMFAENPPPGGGGGVFFKEGGGRVFIEKRIRLYRCRERKYLLGRYRCYGA